MGNQQAKTSDLDMGWLVGMFDGEGSFGLYASAWKPRKYGREQSYVPRISVCGTHIGGLERVVRILTELDIGHYVLWQRQGRRKPLWRVNVAGMKRAASLLPIIAPYLTIRREVAETVYDFVRLRLNANREAPFTEHEHSLIARCYQLNSIGGKANNPFGVRGRKNASETTCRASGDDPVKV